MKAKLAVLAAVAASVVAGAGSAGAVTVEDALCRKTVQTWSAKIARKLMSQMDKCVYGLELGAAPATDCNSLDFPQLTGELNPVIAKARAYIRRNCDDVPPSYPNCPSPADSEDAGGATSGVDDVDELIDCQIALNTRTILPLRDYVVRPNAPAILAHPQASGLRYCARWIAKGATKMWAATASRRARCQSQNQDLDDPYAYACSTYTDSILESAEASVRTRILRYCASLTAGDMALIGSCATNPQDVADCVVAAAKKSGGGATAAAFEFAGVCPTQVEVVVNGGGSAGQRNSNTSLDVGWAGYGHDGDLSDGFAARVDLACSSDDCSSCAVTASCDGGNCRCANDSSIACTTPFVTGAPCGANLCVVHFGPPLPISAGGSSICVVNQILTPFGGTADIGTATSSTPIQQSSKAYLGISHARPCPVCINDTVFDDGVRNGTCDGGARHGLACDADARNTSYGATSYDCPPSAATNVTGAGLKIALNLTDGAVSLPFDETCDAPLGTLACACGACSTDPSVACQTDAECAPIFGGTCMSAGGPARQPNDCDDLTCSADADLEAGADEGACAAGPVDAFCDGLTQPDGEGCIPCTTNADCASLTPPAGNCTLAKRRDCYLDPVIASGVAGTEGGELVSTFCTSPTASAYINAAFGLPGAARVRLDVEHTAYCPAPNDTTEFELGGANCN